MQVKSSLDWIKRPLLFWCSRICFLASVLSVLFCVCYNLTLEHYIGLMNTPSEAPSSGENEISDGELIFGDLSDHGGNLIDLNGVPIVSDTKSVINILLIGTDARTSGAPCRSDAMILVSINKKTEKIVACSLLRDILVSIDGYADNRLNTAYSYGGADLLLDTLEQNFNIRAQYFVSVDFSSFARVVDLFGGIELSITAEEAAVMNGIIKQMNRMPTLETKTALLPVKDGVYHLNGMQALAYARDRSSAMGDFDRTGRQRTVLTSLIGKIKAVSIFELLNLFTEILPNITTNIPEAKIKALVSNIPEYLNYNIVMTALPVEKSFSFITVRNMAVIDIDFEKNIRYLSAEIYS